MGDEERTPHPRGGTPEERSDHLAELAKARRSRVAKIVVALLLLILFVIFVIQNSTRVPVDFVFFTREARLIWVFLASAAVGGLIGYLLGRPSKEQRRAMEEVRAREAARRQDDHRAAE